eukprot:scaffold21_cov368-Prasinococcus_capsulatus_cf.AAC.6
MGSEATAVTMSRRASRRVSLPHGRAAFCARRSELQGRPCPRCATSGDPCPGAALHVTSMGAPPPSRARTRASATRCPARARRGAVARSCWATYIRAAAQAAPNCCRRGATLAESLSCAWDWPGRARRGERAPMNDPA